jgi:hypothetical protein
MTSLLKVFMLASVPPAILYAGLLWSSDERGLLTHVLGDWIRTVQERERMDFEGDLFLRSTEVTHKIVADLDSGRLTLREAAAVLRAERESRPAQFRVGWTPRLGESVEECYLRQLFWEAQCRLERNPRRQAILARLRAEYYALRKDDPIESDEASLSPTTSERHAVEEHLH